MLARTLAALIVAVTFLGVRPALGGVCSDWAPGPLGGFTGADNTVFAFTSWDPDGSGPEPTMLVAGGVFDSIQGTPVGLVAARDPRTGLWQALGYPYFPALAVHALTVHGGDLIAGGSFVHLGGQTVSRIARWDGTAWQEIGGGMSGEVRALLSHGGQLYAAGSFSSAGGQPAANIARWDGAAWHPLGSGTNAIVLALGLYQGEVVAGGSFSQAGGAAASRIARWNGSTWQPLGSGMNTSVYALQVYGSDLVASGAFSSAGGAGANHIARWNGASWQPLGSGTDNAIRALAVHGSELVAGGRFGIAGGVAASCVARWNGASWQPLAGGVDGPEVFALHAHQGELMVGGSFGAAGTAPARNLARWIGSAWLPFGGGGIASVLSFVDFRGRLVAGGNFSHATPGPWAYFVAGWNGVHLQTLGSGFDGPINDLEAFKYPGAFGDYELIAGGSFTVAGGGSAQRIARWQEDPIAAFPPPAWEPMGTGFNDVPFAIERFNSQTYVAGAFTNAGNRIARWNESTDVWEPLGTGMNGVVYDLASYGGFLYAGGAFTSAGGVATGGLARWNGTSWSQVGGFFNGTVWALGVHNGELVIGGVYPGINSSPNLARWNGATYSTYGIGGTNGQVRAVASLGGRLYIAGNFTSAGGVPVDHVAAWDGATWHDVPGGPTSYPYSPGPVALHASRDELHVGGGFLRDFGDRPSPAWLRYLTTRVPWITYHPSSQARDPGSDAIFSAHAADGYDVTTQWYRNGAPLGDGPSGTGSTRGGTTTPTLRISHLTFFDAGSYHAVVTNGCGADTSLAAELTINGTADSPGDLRPPADAFAALGPNPARGEARADFALARAARARIRVHDVGGRAVRVLDLGRLGAGRHHARWDGRTGEGRAAGAGLYFVTLEADGRRLGTRRLVVQR